MKTIWTSSRNWAQSVIARLSRPRPIPPSLPRVRATLSVKLSVVVVAIALLVILVSSTLLLGFLEQQSVERAEEMVAHLNLPLVAALRHAMLTGDAAMVNAIVADVARELGDKHIRILDSAGEVRASSNSIEIGLRLQPTSEACVPCHRTAATVPPRSVVRAQVAGQPVFLSASPIENEPACVGCHAADGPTLGLILIQAPQTDLDRQRLALIGRVLLSVLVGGGLLVTLFIPALRWLVLTPIAELSQGAAAIGAGNLDYRLRLDRGDELGTLAGAFETMRAQLKAERVKMEQGNQELAVLYEAALVTGQLLELPQTVDLALDIVVGRLQLDVGLIYLWDSRQGRFVVTASRGLSGWQLQLIDHKRRRIGGDLTAEVAQSGEVRFVPDISQDLHFAGTFQNPHLRSYVNIPLKSKDKVVGTLELLSQAGQPMTQRQVDILTALGHQVGIAIDNTALLADTRRAAHEALTLYRVGTAVTASLDPTVVLQAVASGARQVLAANLGLVALLDEHRQALVVRAVDGASQPGWHALRWPLDPASALALTEPMHLTALPAGLPAPLAQLLAGEHLQSLLLVPLLRGDQLSGVLVVLAQDPQAFGEGDGLKLARLAQQVVVAVENARLYQQVRLLAVLEERDRLARELHDNLAQALAYLNLKASLTGGLLANGDTQQAEASLLEMKQIAGQAYTDTREAIFNLRTAGWLEADLVPMLHAYLAEYRTHYGLDTQLIVAEGAATQFAQEVAAQVSRIIQEALTNIRKHAQATQASIYVEREAAHTRLVIQDNGRGFDPQAVHSNGQEHFGLAIMRERAAGVGGTVEVLAGLGRGTRVIIRVPCPAGQGVAV